ncbi:MAG: DUF3592 domain-containing protein [Acidimicrobiia bacterium]|nr:DUF3592 domain-containing protein [Acidimicrobiia bacterium]
MTIVSRIFLALFGVLFALVTVVGIVGLLQTKTIVDTYARVEGAIAEVDQDVGGDGNLQFTAIIRYQTIEGEVWQFRSSVTSGSRPPRDVAVTVLYDPDNPEDAIEDTFRALWLVPLVITGVGVIGSVAVGIAVVRRRRRRTPTEPRETISDRNTRLITATFSHVQPRGPDDKGRFQYRVVAVQRVGGVKNTYQSDWMEENPTVAIMAAGNQLPVRLHGDGTGTVLLD